MVEKILSSDEVGQKPYQQHKEGDKVFFLETIHDAADFLGHACIDPDGQTHILYSVSVDGYVECPKDFKYPLSQIRLEAYHEAEKVAEDLIETIKEEAPVVTDELKEETKK